MQSSRLNLALAPLKPLLRAYYRWQDVRNPNLLGELRPLWRDQSSNQGWWNAAVSVANNVQGVILRAGYGLVPDPRFTEYWAQAGNVGLYRTSYWAIYPNLDWVKQLDLWYAQHPTLDIVPRMDDIEVAGGVAPAQIAECHWWIAEKIRQRDGKDPLMYSRANLINVWFVPYWTANQLNRYLWVLAQYLSSGAEHPGPPTLPKGLLRERVFGHQTSDHRVDFEGEFQGLMCDWLRFELGDEAEMHAFIRARWGGAPQPPPLTLEQRVTDLERRVTNLGG